VLGRLRKVLGVLTDILNFGRSKGWWQRRQSPLGRKEKPRGNS